MHAPIALWRDYNKRAGCECVIKELDAGFALPKLILSKFWASEAALSLAVVSYNLVVLFEQKLGWQDKRVTVGTLRYGPFVTACVLGNHARKKTLKFAVPKSQRAWWERLWAKIASPYPNCNAVGPAPPRRLPAFEPPNTMRFLLPTAWLGASCPAGRCRDR